MASEDLILRVRTTDTGLAVDELGKVDKAVKKVGSTTQQTGKRAKESAGHFKLFGSALGGIKFAAGVAGFSGIALGIKDAVSEAMSLQSTQAQLRQALKASGVAGAGAFDQMNKAADKLALHGGFAAPQELQGMTQFVRLTGSATKAIALNGQTTELARGAHLDFATAQRIVGQALTGNVGRLQRYIGIIQPVKTAVQALTAAHKLNIYQLDLQAKAMGKAGPAWLKQQELYAGINPQALAHAQLLDKQATAQEVLTRIQAKYAGATQTFSHTAAGALSNAKNAIGQAAASIGKVLLPIIAKVAGALASVATTVAAHWPQISHVIMAVVTPIVDFGKAIFNALRSTKLLIPVLAGLVAGFVAMKVIGAVSAAMRAGTEAATGLRLAFIALGIGEAAVAAETEALSVTMKTALASTGIGLVVVALVLLVTHFKLVKQIAGQVISWLVGAVRSAGQAISSIVSTMVELIKGVWGTLVAILEFPFKVASSFIEGVFHAISRFITGVVSTIGRIFSKVFHIIAWPFQEAWKVIKGIVNSIVGAVKSVLNIPGKILGGIGSVASSIGGFLGLNKGGVVRDRAHYFDLGGPVGSDTVPAWLTPGEGVLNRAAMSMVGERGLNAMNSGTGMGGGQMTIEPMPVTLQLDSRVLYRAMVQMALKQAARGPSSLVGGAMTTGASTAG